ncbi:MAG TPA: carboxypeptidase-like regulatory domain-containing protein [Candidatus Ozemobacteraceae bacterium]|nr:carboxypeptidase-like regulatory domain-containing protein [Candidatus Ozemobacteraceae bacterium]
MRRINLKNHWGGWLQRTAFSVVAGMAALMVAGWSSPVPHIPFDILTRREVAIHLSRAVKPLAGSASLPADIGSEAAVGLSPIIAAGYMGLYPDGSFRPDEPMRIGEVLSVWARVWRGSEGRRRPSGSAGISSSDRAPAWSWGAEDLSLLAGVDAVAAAGVAAFSPSEPATRGFWRYLPMPEAGCAPVSAKPGDELAQKPKPAFGRVIDAVTGKAVPGAVGTIDSRAFTTDREGMFPIPEAGTDDVRDVFVAVDGYRSLSLRWNRKLRPGLKLSLKPFRAPLEIRVLSAAGVPAAGVRIALDSSMRCETDTEGMAKIRAVKPGYYRLMVESPGSATASMLISVAESGGCHTVRLPASSAL